MTNNSVTHVSIERQGLNSSIEYDGSRQSMNSDDVATLYSNTRLSGGCRGKFSLLVHCMKTLDSGGCSSKLPFCVFATPSKRDLFLR